MGKDGERIAKLEQSFDFIKDKVQENRDIIVNIRDNHLHTIEGKVDSIERKLAVYAAVGVTLLTVLEIGLKLYK